VPQLKSAVLEPDGLPARQSGTRALPQSPFTGVERERLLDRLQQLRGILPVFAQELASARRQAAALRVQNRELLEEVHRLRAQREDNGSVRR